MPIGPERLGGLDPGDQPGETGLALTPGALQAQELRGHPRKIRHRRDFRHLCHRRHTNKCTHSGATRWALTTA